MTWLHFPSNIWPNINNLSEYQSPKFTEMTLILTFASFFSFYVKYAIKMREACFLSPSLNQYLNQVHALIWQCVYLGISVKHSFETILENICIWLSVSLILGHASLPRKQAKKKKTVFQPYWSNQAFLHLARIPESAYRSRERLIIADLFSCTVEEFFPNHGWIV